MSIRRFVRAGLALSAAAVFAAACGSSSPSEPSGTTAVRVEGTLLGGTGSAGFTALSSQTAAAESGPIVVTVKGTSISVTVSGNGTFVLEGLPEGSFTLVFTQGGVVLGEVTVTNVAAGAHVKIIVQMSGNTVILVQLTIEDQEKPGDSSLCLISGGTAGQGIQLEGNVASISDTDGASFKMDVNGNRSSGLVDVSASAASFSCIGNAKSADCKSQLKPGAKVHVSGTLTACSPTAATVVATEVKIQK